MQALILFPRNTCGIRSNPEGYSGAYRTSTVQKIMKFVHTTFASSA